MILVSRNKRCIPSCKCSKSLVLHLQKPLGNQSGEMCPSVQYKTLCSPGGPLTLDTSSRDLSVLFTPYLVHITPGVSDVLGTSKVTSLLL